MRVAFALAVGLLISAPLAAQQTPPEAGTLPLSPWVRDGENDPLRQVIETVEVDDRIGDPLAVLVTGEDLHGPPPAEPGRGLLESILDTPGWIFEANAVPHPRGSEYGTTFVLDGVPRTEILSPSFAAPPEAHAAGSAEVLTSGYSAAYGRSLGGLVHVDRPLLAGSDAALTVGSFGSVEGDLGLTVRDFHGSLEGFATDRFLDPPTTRDHTNGGRSLNLELQQDLGRDWTLSFDANDLHRGVPNEEVQEAAGQRQTVHTAAEGAGVQWSHAAIHDVGIHGLGVHGVLAARRGSFALESNPQSTPIQIDQERSFGEVYGRFDVTGETRHESWRMGGDAFVRRIHERDSFHITDPAPFDPGTEPDFHFRGAHGDIEPAAYAEDTLSAKGWVAVLGLRFDDFRFLVHETGWSPRVVLKRQIGPITLHGAFDRVMEFPSFENLLVASSAQGAAIETGGVAVPLRPGRANFYEIGATSVAMGDAIELSAAAYLRRWTRFEDDDTLLNTGVSVPFTDRNAAIHGETLALRVFLHGWLTRVAYTNQVGVAEGPVTGGLLIGKEGMVPQRFPISQDQRNSVRATVGWTGRRFGLRSRIESNSGLPVEIDDGDTPARLTGEYGPAVLSKINFARGRVRPWNSVDLDGSMHLRSHLDATGGVRNLANGLHVVNFASLFSGTAIAAPRSYYAQLRLAW